MLAIRKLGEKIEYKVVNVDDGLSSDPTAVLTLVTATDIVYIPKTAISNIALVVKQIADVFFFRGWGFSFGYDLDNRF